jgi:hypothetical protein
MKRPAAVTNSLLGAAALVAADLLVAAPASAQPSYRLNCRGGPSMRIVTNHDVPSPGHVGAIAMTISFQAGAIPALPGPGQCVWMDRGFRPGEPQQLWFRSETIEFAFQIDGHGRVVRDATGPRLNAEGMTAEAADWSRVVAAVLNGGAFAVEAYNVEGRVMNVTAILP